MEYSQWDWDVGKRVIADVNQWRNAFNRVEEPYVSPDGETIAAIVEIEEMVFSVCENGVPWENQFDKIWYLRFGPDNVPSALVSSDAAWTVATAGQPWKNQFDFVWDMQFGATGKYLTVAAQCGGEYFAVANDIPWQQKYPALNNLTISKDGKNSAAVVQTRPFNSGDIFAFQQGCYSAAVNGKIWGTNFLNIWEMSFSPDGRHLAAESRSTLYDYTIVVDGVPWNKNFSSVWKPRFNPVDGSVSAPVKGPGGWTLACDGEILWDKPFLQLWHHQYSADGKNIAAIVVPKFGQWTIAVNGVPWPETFDNLVTDLVFSPDGKRVACSARTHGKWTIAADGRGWKNFFDMAWAPVFSPDSRHVAAKVEKNGRFFLVIDGRVLKQTFSALWEPIFSPDSTKLLIRGIEAQNTGQYCRYVIKLSDLV